MDRIHLINAVGITGTQSFSINKNGDSKTTEIISTGSMNAYHIPPVLVFCEDEIAKDAITHTLTDGNGISHCSFKFIISGSWENIIISLAGSLLYSDELTKTGNTKVLSTVGILDGDITDTEISNVIAKCYRGNRVPDNLIKTTKKIREHLVRFRLPEDIINKKRTTGKPELNLKRMLEEISEESINTVLGGKIIELKSCLERNPDHENRAMLKNDIFFLEKEIEDILEIIKISKKLSARIFKKRTGSGTTKTDYHSYLQKLEKELKTRHFVTYGPGTPPPLLLIYRLIKKFTPERWSEYTGPVIDFLTPIAEKQRERFSHNTYNNKVID